MLAWLSTSVYVSKLKESVVDPSGLGSRRTLHLIAHCKCLIDCGFQAALARFLVAQIFVQPRGKVPGLLDAHRMGMRIDVTCRENPTQADLGSIHPVCDAGSSRGGGDVDVPPVPGQEFIQVRCGMISDAAQDIGQPGAGIDVVQLSCCDQRVHGSGALPAAIGRGLIVPWFRSQNLRSDIRSIR